MKNEHSVAEAFEWLEADILRNFLITFLLRMSGFRS